MAKQELGSPFLLNLGLSIQQQNSYPTEENYPSKFSPNALNEWKESLIFSKNLSPVEAWGKVIGEFLKNVPTIINSLLVFLERILIAKW